ncbi:MAG TPA: S24/S26 family peptidase [Gemmatimonadales bacterium]
MSEAMHGSTRASNRDPRLVAKELQVAVSSPNRTLYFHGESMRPLLVEGDEVVVEPVSWDRIRTGDIITYRYLDRFPTRRVVGKTADRLDLWCDNWPDRSFTAGREDVLGRAIARRRDGVWLTSAGREWKRARRTALARHLRVVRLTPLYWRVRGMAGDMLRSLGLRQPRPGR